MSVWKKIRKPKKKKRNELVLVVMSCFVLYNAIFNFFITTTSVSAQTFYYVFNTSIIVWFINTVEVAESDTPWRFIKIVLLWYLTGTIGLYVYNWIKYPDFYDWARYFNSYHVVLTTFMITTFGAIIHAWRVLKS